jgi:Tfp pilus assembly protein PilW
MKTVFRRRARRGISLFEVVLASTIGSFVVAILATFSILEGRSWHKTNAVSLTQQNTQLALQLMSPTIRAAHSVVTSQTTSSMLVLRMPAYDASGNLIVPIQDGNTTSFYLSDTSGSTSKSGTILWRAVNGTPDSAWSLKSGAARVTLSSGGLSFSLIPSGDPDSVVVNLTANATSGTQSSTLSTSKQIVIRNKGL